MARGPGGNVDTLARRTADSPAMLELPTTARGHRLGTIVLVAALASGATTVGTGGQSSKPASGAWFGLPLPPPMGATPAVIVGTRGPRPVAVPPGDPTGAELNANTIRADLDTIVGFSKDAPIGLVSEDFAPAPWLGLLGFLGAIVWLYGWMLRRSAAVRS